MFFVVALLIWSAMHVYVVWRAASVPFVAAHLPRRWLIAVAVFLALSYLAARFLDRSWPGAIAHALEHVGALWFGVIFLAVVCLLAVDLGTGFGWLWPRAVPGLRGWALVGAVLLSLLGWLIAHRTPVVREHEVRLADLPPTLDGTVLVFVSDLHAGTLLDSRWLGARVEQVAALAPDLIVLGGDILEGDHREEAELVQALSRLRAPLGVYAVTGNHEFYAGLEPSVRRLRAAGLRVLRDEWVEAAPGLVLAGVDDLTARRQMAPDPESITRALAGRPEGATVFLSHSPLEVEQAARAGVGLMLSGHTHGGQIWPFGEIVRLARYPLLAGRYEVGGMTAIVCRGTGTWGPRLRLWHPSELLRLTLRSAAPS